MSESTNKKYAVVAKRLYAALTKDHPAPWSVTYDEFYPDHLEDVMDANLKEVLHLSTHSGDGDMFYLGGVCARELVQFVNMMKRLEIEEVPCE